MSKLIYNLWIDDVRNPDQTSFEKLNDAPIIWARDVEQAKYYIRLLGMPCVMYLDHDLGELSTVMPFLSWLDNLGYDPDFTYLVISANPDGAKNIKSFINSWKRSASTEREGA
jgi:Tol biopolymer transport system component